MGFIHMSSESSIIKGEYSVEVSCYDGKKVLWGVVDDHVVKDTNNNDELWLRLFGVNLFGVDEGGEVREVLSEYFFCSYQWIYAPRYGIISCKGLTWVWIGTIGDLLECKKEELVKFGSFQ